MAKLTEEGWELFRKWEKIYEDERERIASELNDPDYTEGWCIIDNYDFVKTVEDEVGLLIFGYDEGIGSYFEFWEAHGEPNDVCFTDINGHDYTFAEVEKLVVPYYTEYFD